MIIYPSYSLHCDDRACYSHQYGDDFAYFSFKKRFTDGNEMGMYSAVFSNGQLNVAYKDYTGVLTVVYDIDPMKYIFSPDLTVTNNWRVYPSNMQCFQNPCPIDVTPKE